MKAHEAGAGYGCVQEATSERPVESLCESSYLDSPDLDSRIRWDKRLAVAVLACSLLAVWQAPAFGKGFAGVRSFNVGATPQSVAVGDFNGDGKPDMVVANSGDNTVGVLLGNGDGTFQAQVTYAVGSSPYAVAVGDFNGDGYLDFAVANDGSNNVSILLGNGDGTFRAAVSYAVGLGAFSVAVADFNADGHLDLAVADSGIGKVSVLLGNGDGTFQTPLNYAVGSNPRAVAVGDFNGDGKLDLAVANTNGNNVSILLGNGNGTFEPAVNYAAGTSPSSVAVGDFNNDGRPDLAVANSTSVDVLIGNGDGTFQSAASFAAGTSPEGVAAGDFNGDGNQDLVVANSGSSNVSILLGTGSGSFQTAVNYIVGSGPSALAVADFNNNGQLDLAETNVNDSTVDVLLGEGNGTFQVAVNYPNGGLSLAVGDFNGDGKPDLAAVQNGSSVAILIGNGDGSFQPAKNYSTVCCAFAVAVGDFNGDGKLDLATVNDDTSGAVSILLGNGDGTFQSPLTFPTGGYLPRSVAVGDFNGDGKLDVAVANYCGTSYCGNSGTVAILLGNGDGTFQPAVGYNVGSHPASVAVGDFNGDGKLDLAVANLNDDTVSVLLGNGDGTFQGTIDYSSPGGAISVAVGDFNGDGKLDLAVGGGNFVGVLLGNGDGSFQAVTNFAVGYQHYGMALADFNGDGHLDIATANSSGNSVSILLGNGNGSFQPPLNYGVGSNLSVVAGDFDQGGAPDLIVGTGGVAILLNTGGTLIATTSSQNPSSPGQSVTFTATVTENIPGTGDPSGTVTFLDDSTTLGTVALSSGTASLTTSSLSVGTHSITVKYSGDANFNPHTGSPVIQIVANPAPIVRLSSTSLSFGSQNSGTTSAAQTVTLTNGGNATLKITSIATSGDFAETNTCPSSLAANANCAISVTFTPTAVGTRTGAVTITDNASNSPQTISLTGTGVGVPGVSLSTTSLTFGNETIGLTSAAQPVTLTNTGSATLVISGIVPSANYGESNNCGSGLLAGAACTINVTFAPATNGTLPGTLTFTDNAADSPQTVTLAGTGVAPVPAINQPLIPQRAIPGGAPFTLTLNGIGFFPGSVVRWNGSPRATTFVSSTRLTAAIQVTDIAAAGTASVTVSNPGPGGGLSNAVFFDITNPTSFLSFTRLDIATQPGPQAVAEGDFNGDGKLDLAVANLTSNSVSVFLGNGDGTFQAPVNYPVGTAPRSVIAVDLNGDGKLDLATADRDSNTISVLLGNGDGAFQAAVPYATGARPGSVMAGDFNRDGVIDLAVVNQGSNTISVLLGNGDGTFQAHADYAAGSQPFYLAAGDFNGDGRLDLAVANDIASGTVSILLGNGDGSFQAPVSYATGSNPTSLIAADFNGGGRLDLAVTDYASNTVSILLGNGDGTFQNHVDYATSTHPFAVTAADLNGDGKLDLAVGDQVSSASSVSVLLGNGDGTFQNHVEYGVGGGASSVVAGDFNGDGRLDLAVTNSNSATFSVLLQNAVATLSKTSLSFGSQPIGTKSGPQTVSLTNTGSASMGIFSIGITGSNSADFAETNTCPSSLIGGASCTVSVTFSPKAAGTRTASVTIYDNAAGSPQSISLSGTGGAAAVKLSASSLTFATELVGTASPSQPVTLTNTGSAALSISSISATGDFAETNTCGSSVAAGASCKINVTFKPTLRGNRTGALTLSDNAPGSPQTVSLAGTGTVVKLSRTSIAFGVVLLGTTSASQTVTLTNAGGVALNISSIGLTGGNSGQFAQTHTCGSSLGAGLGCTISVTFKPTATGSKTAALSISDDGGGSPQTVSLTGTVTVVKLSRASVGFGAVVVGTTSASQTVTLTNIGSVALSISSIGLTGANAGDFAQTNTCGSSLSAGLSCTISVTFKPTATGSRSAAVSISDSGGGSPQTVSLSGTGTAVSLSASSLSFGSEKVGTVSAQKMVTLTNTGAATLDISGITVTGADPGDFIETNSCDGSVAAKAQCVITVQFAPTATGSRPATVSISDDGGGSPQKISLGGTGT